MSKEDLTLLSEKELVKRLNELNWCDRDLVNEYDERRKDGRIKYSGNRMRSEDLPEFFRKRREAKEKKAS